MARTAWVPTNRAPRRLTSTTRRRESSVSAHGGVRLRTPALLTSPSTAPYSFRHLATSSPAQSQSATEPADANEEVVVALVEDLRSPGEAVPRTQAPAPIDADPHRHPYHRTGSSATPYTELSCLNRISSWGTASSSPGNRAKSRA